jgi:hypothetical protein
MFFFYPTHTCTSQHRPLGEHGLAWRPVSAQQGPWSAPSPCIAPKLAACHRGSKQANTILDLSCVHPTRPEAS